jgi:hypothetical protein
MDVTKPYTIIGFGAMDVTKPSKFIGFGAMEATKPYEFIGFGAMNKRLGRRCEYILVVLSPLVTTATQEPNTAFAISRPPWAKHSGATRLGHLCTVKCAGGAFAISSFLCLLFIPTALVSDESGRAKGWVELMWSWAPQGASCPPDPPGFGGCRPP